MAHPAIAEAAVIAIPHEKWDERPLAVVRAARGRRRATPDELREFLAPELREVVAAGRVRVRRRDPEDGGRQVPQDGAARAVREASRVARSGDRGQDVPRHRRPLGARRGDRARCSRREGATVVIADLPETDVTDEAAVRALVEPLRRSCTASSTAPGSAGARASSASRSSASARRRGEPDRHVQRALARGREDGARTSRTRRARAA